MNIRTKCALLIIAFEATLAASIVLTIYYTKNYFEDAANSFAMSRATVDAIGRVRGEVLNELTRLIHQPQLERDIKELRSQSFQISNQVATIASQSNESIRRNLETLDLERRARLEAALSKDDATAFNPDVHRELDRELGRVEADAWNDVRNAVSVMTDAQRTTTFVLFSNMLIGVVLGLLGLYLVRRWVILPVDDLKVATDKLARGDRQVTAAVHSPDELGQLAAAFNRMTAEIGRMEQRLIQRERLVAMGELVSYIAHNIRNPLAGVQSSAEVTCRKAASSPDIVEQQRHIIAAIDRCLRWFKQIEHACGSIEISPEPTDVRSLIEDVLTVFRPIAAPQKIHLGFTTPSSNSSVVIDVRHFEQAVTAIVGNAVEAVREDGSVEITFKDRNGEDDRWSLTIADNGPGIPAEATNRVFEPTYSTKPDGHGLGLSMARKVAEMHGGELHCGNRPEGGAIFTFVMPANPHGYESK